VFDGRFCSTSVLTGVFAGNQHQAGGGGCVGGGGGGWGVVGGGGGLGAGGVAGGGGGAWFTTCFVRTALFSVVRRAKNPPCASTGVRGGGFLIGMCSPVFHLQPSDSIGAFITILFALSTARFLSRACSPIFQRPALVQASWAFRSPLPFAPIIPSLFIRNRAFLSIARDRASASCSDYHDVLVLRINYGWASPPIST